MLHPVADDLWQTLLFLPSGAPAVDGRISPRAGYQELLHGRAVLLDLRSPATRAREGVIAVDACEVPVDRAPRTVLLLDDATPAAAGRTPRGARVIDGGLTAWRAAGLPVARVPAVAAAAQTHASTDAVDAAA